MCVVDDQGLPDRSLQLFAETGCSKTPVPHSDVAGLYVAVHEDPFKLVEVRHLCAGAILSCYRQIEVLRVGCGLHACMQKHAKRQGLPE